MTKLPKDNSLYGDLNYWNERYENEDTYDWFKTYNSFKQILKNIVKPTDNILMLGCGNSSLSEDMYKDGFHNIVNIDYSPVVIEKMKTHSSTCEKMQWIVMDVTEMSFPDDSFDVILEKGTLDAMLVAEKDPWNVSKEAAKVLDRVFTKVSSILRTRGKFISITFSQPHFRRSLLAKPQYRWSFEYFTCGDAFHYFLYYMTKGNDLQQNSTNCLPNT